MCYIFEEPNLYQKKPNQPESNPYVHRLPYALYMPPHPAVSCAESWCRERGLSPSDSSHQASPRGAWCGKHLSQTSRTSLCKSSPCQWASSPRPSWTALYLQASSASWPTLGRAASPLSLHWFLHPSGIQVLAPSSILPSSLSEFNMVPPRPLIDLEPISSISTHMHGNGNTYVCRRYVTIRKHW